MAVSLTITLVILSIPYHPIRAPHMWTPLSGSLPIDVLRDVPGGKIALMRHDGSLLSDSIDAHLGQFDAIELMPAIRSLDEPAYLQFLAEDGQPIGSAIVIEPALSRRVPIAEKRHDDERGDWTHVIGWQDEGAEDHEELPAGSGRINHAAMSETVPRDGAVIRSGWWAYGEQDVFIQTDHGEIVIDLREDAAPNTARNFRDLAARGFYDSTIVHRIIPEGRNGRPFVVQGGDPTGTGTGGPGWWLPLEPSTLGHAFGVISMARADDPDSAGSQWFIALDREECARLDGLYCAFGEAVSGGDAIVSMAMTPLADTDYFSSRPVDPPLVQSMNVVPAPPRAPHVGRPQSRIQPPRPDWSDGLRARAPHLKEHE